MKALPSKSPSPLTLRDLLRRRAALVLLPVVFAASFAMAQVGVDKTGADKRRSGYQDMGAALQKMQDDDTANPGMLFVQLGQQLWAKPAGAANKACADCHAVADMKGVAARYPAIPKDGDKPIDLEGRIRLCRATNQQAEPLAPESRELLSLAAFVANQSRGLPIAPSDDPRLAPFRRAGSLRSRGVARASSTSAAPSATTTMPARSWPASPSRRPIRPAIRSTAWNGRPWARSSGGCATVWSASALRPILTRPWSMSPSRSS